MWKRVTGLFAASGITVAMSVFSVVLSSVASASEFSYEAIAKRHSESRLDPSTVADAKMQGECLVGLKNLNFRKRDDFDPVAEWTNYRSLSLLEQMPPCTVLIIMEVARVELIDEADEP